MMKTFLVGKAVRNQLLDLPYEGRPEHFSGTKEDLDAYLATCDLTIHAIAQDSEGNIYDPFNGQQDIEEGLLRHTTPEYVGTAQNIMTTAVCGAELSRWGFRVSHGTYGLLKKMVGNGMTNQLTTADKSSAIHQAMHAKRPSEFFRILHRCGALKLISRELNDCFETGDSHTEQQLPEMIRKLDENQSDIDEKLRVILEQDFAF